MSQRLKLLPVEIVWLIEEYCFGTPNYIYDNVVKAIHEFSPMFLHIDVDGCAVFGYRIQTEYKTFRYQVEPRLITDERTETTVTKLILDHLQVSKCFKTKRDYLPYLFVNIYSRKMILTASDDIIGNFMLKYIHTKKLNP